MSTTRRWYVLQEQPDYDSLSVTGPVHLDEARWMARLLTGTTYVVNSGGHMLG